MISGHVGAEEQLKIHLTLPNKVMENVLAY